MKARLAPLLACIALAACPPPRPTAEAPPRAEPAARPQPEAAAPPQADAAPPEPDPQPTPPPAPLPRPLRICAGGDMMLGNNLDTLWARRASDRLGFRVPPFPDPDSLLSPLRPLVGDADIVLLNVEGAIGDGPAPTKCRPGSTSCFAFRQPVHTAAALARLAGDAVLVANVANNHAMDAGPQGFLTSIAHLEDAGAHVTGFDTLATPVPVSDTDTIAFLGFSPFRAGPDPRDLSALRRHVARAFARYGRVVVSMHVGAEGRGAQRTPDRNEIFLGEDRGNSVAIARAATQAGAGLVIGHGPHVLRAAQWRGDALVFFSLGNTLTYGPFNLQGPNGLGGIACASLDSAGRVTDAVFRSTYQVAPGLVRFDPAARGAALVDSLARLDFPGSAARVLASGNVVK